MEARLIRDCLVRAVVCASKDETRPHLNAVRITTDRYKGKLTVRATNGHLALVLNAPVPVDDLPATDVDVMVPADVVQTWIRYLGQRAVKQEKDVKLDKDALRVGQVVLPTEAVNDTPPNVDRVIPTIGQAKGLPDGVIGIDPQYYAVVGVAFRDLMPRTYTFGVLDPVVFYVDDTKTGLEIKLAVMPFRL